MKTKNLKLFITIFFPCVLFFLNPLHLSSSQNLLFSCIVLGILLWATELIDRTLVSIALLLVFLLCSDVSAERIFTFPLSENFITIVSSFLISAGVVNSGAAKKIAERVLIRYCTSLVHLVIAACVLNAVLVFFIPQCVPRVTLIGSIYYVLLNTPQITQEQRKAVLLGVFITATSTALLIKNGDVILNNAALDIMGIAVTQSEWIKYMTVPTILSSILLLLFYIIFQRGNLKSEVHLSSTDAAPLHRQGIATCIIMVCVVALWMTESIHGISPSFIALAGVLAMFVTGILKVSDLKCINLSLLIFLTAEFGLGNVLVDSGIAEVISGLLMDIVPASENIYFVVFLLSVSVFILHALFGGAMSALAICLPIIGAIWGDVLNKYVLSMLVLILVTCHYVFPYNQLTMLVGYGQGYYAFKDILKLTLPLAVIVLIMLFTFYLPWWKITGCI